MAIYDNNGVVNYEINKVYDNNGTADTQIGKIYDNDGTANRSLYESEQYLFSPYNTWSSFTGGWRDLEESTTGSWNTGTYDLSILEK